MANTTNSRNIKHFPFNFDVMLTVHPSTFISVINQLDVQNFCAHGHMCSKHVEAWNKLIAKQKFCESIWLITEINFPLNFPVYKHRFRFTCVVVFQWRFISYCIFIAYTIWENDEKTTSVSLDGSANFKTFYPKKRTFGKPHAGAKFRTRRLY